MNKFKNLLVKEIRELITWQLIISLAMTILLFYFIGNLIKQEERRAAATQKIAVLDLDKSAFSIQLLDKLKIGNFQIEPVQAADKESAVRSAKTNDTNFLLIVPAGFGDSVANFQPKELETYSFLRSISIGVRRSSSVLQAVIQAVNKFLSDDFLRKKVPDISPENIKAPIKSKDFVIVKDRMAEGSAAAISGFVFAQTIFVPIILMMIIIYSSQMVISAIAMEKQNKTLETLLTVPIRRTSIVTAKMLAAGLVGLISAVIYMIGYWFAMGGLMGDLSSATGIKSVIQKLGLAMTTKGYLILGVSLFMAILCALALATILGVLAEDFRAAQGLIMPLVFLVMIPYIISFFADFRTMSLPFKMFVWAIPFSHPFLATQNILMENNAAILYGILYMLVFFIVLVVIAGRIFSTDKVLTMKLKLGKKKIVM